MNFDREPLLNGRETPVLRDAARFCCPFSTSNPADPGVFPTRRYEVTPYEGFFRWCSSISASVLVPNHDSSHHWHHITCPRIPASTWRERGGCFRGTLLDEPFDSA